MFACIYGQQQLRAEVSGTLAGRSSSTPSAPCRWGSRAAEAATLAEFAYAFSPLVEETAPDTVVIDVEGCALLFGSAYELATEIANQAESKGPAGLGCKVNVALAANPDAAIHAAKFFQGITFISPGEELATLGDLPIECLISPDSRFQIPNSKVKNKNKKEEADTTGTAADRKTSIGTAADRKPSMGTAADRKTSDPTMSAGDPTMSALPGKQTLDLGPWTLDKKKWDEILETLRLWGVRTFKEFAALPVAGVSERLGQDGLKLQELASGKTNRHLKLKQPAPVFTNSIELEYPIAELEPLAFVFARLLNQICASLSAYALATNALGVELKLERGPLHEIKLNLPYPMRDHKVFLKLLLLDMEMHPPPAAIVGVAINCEPVKPRVLQTGLFIPLAPEPEKLELMLARLAKLVGAENIGSPELLDTHRPDAFRVKRFVISQTKKKKRADRTSTPADRKTSAGDPAMSALPARGNSQSEIRNPKFALGFRVFRPPLRALVQAEQGVPIEISAWNKNKSVYGKVVSVAGPWRTTGDWWRVDNWARDEWDVAIEVKGQRSEVGGQRSENAIGGNFGPPRVQVLYRIYQETGNGSWFVEGVYD
jgi:protein ImuB